ncbi:protein ABIL2 [Sesamum alatum]|uniref:Protein ABIL2 n=1 Tax=Sesamum alatum TaxID=300844 RepID=A0AAE1XYL2_9LAMI|nr:protein ABIL2 [Sesamum alatum]
MESSDNGSPPKAPVYEDEMFMQHSLQFADSLKDLKNIRQQLYSAAQYFESSYNRDDHKQFVVESSKHYVAKALVNTVDHLGSVADKLNRFLDQKANEFSSTTSQFSCIEQRLSTFEGCMKSRGLSQSLLMVEANHGHHKHYILPGAENFGLGTKSKELYTCPPYDVQQPKLDNSFSQAAKMKPHRPLLIRKEESRIPSRQPSPNRPSFSFTKVLVPDKEPGRRSVSPFRFPLRRSGSIENRSISPSPPVNKQLWKVEPRRAVSACRRAETTNREREIESYTKRSKHLFRALISVHTSRKQLVHNK